MPTPTQVSRVDHMAGSKGTHNLGNQPASRSRTDPVRLLVHWALAICLAPALLAALLVGGLALVIQGSGRFAASILRVASGPFRSR